MKPDAYLYEVVVMRADGGKQRYSRQCGSVSLRRLLRTLARERDWQPQGWEKMKPSLWRCVVGGKSGDTLYVKRYKAGS